MGVREETAILKDLLEQHISIEEGIFEESDALGLISRICEAVEANGYVVPREFELGEFLQAIESELLSSALAEAELHPAYKVSALKRLVGAAKGAVSRGVISAHKKLLRYHAVKADAALDKSADPDLSPKERGSAEAQFRKHYVKKMAHAQKAAPDSHADIARGKEQWGEPKHGSAAEADVVLQKAKDIVPQHTLMKLSHPAQAQRSREKFVSAHAVSMDDEPMPGTKTKQGTGMTPTFKKITKSGETRPDRPFREPKRDPDATHVLRSR